MLELAMQGIRISSIFLRRIAEQLAFQVEGLSTSSVQQRNFVLLFESAGGVLAVILAGQVVIDRRHAVHCYAAATLARVRLMVLACATVRPPPPEQQHGHHARQRTAAARLPHEAQALVWRCCARPSRCRRLGDRHEHEVDGRLREARQPRPRETRQPQPATMARRIFPSWIFPVPCKFLAPTCDDAPTVCAVCATAPTCDDAPTVCATKQLFDEF